MRAINESKRNALEAEIGEITKTVKVKINAFASVFRVEDIVTSWKCRGIKSLEKIRNLRIFINREIALEKSMGLKANKYSRCDGLHPGF